MILLKKRIIIFILLSLSLVSCATVPVTGRSQFNLIPRSTMLSMSDQQYKAFLKKHKLSNNQQQTQMVKNVGKRIKGAVERFFSEREMSHLLNNYQWAFNLVEGKEINAWCMPGGRVVVYTGILKVARDKEGLAVVLGHEVAHAIARHGNERMSQGLVVQMGGMALSRALEDKPDKTRELWITVFGAGTQLGVMLPYSRLHENEADYLGLIFMAMAGYNPNAAIGFWTRMSNSKKGKQVPEFLSTHPSDKTRIMNIKKLIPEAMEYYRERKTTLLFNE